MTLKALFAIACVSFSTFVFAVTGYSQGVIVPIVCEMRPCRPRPLPQPLPNALPVKSIDLDTKIDGQIATTHVTQVFRNDTQYTLEGTYFFPIPETASIVEFAIWENGKKLVGEVRSREEARRIYDEIVRRQRDPGLLEYAGKDLFQASIFPIPPNSDKKLELTFTQILKAESGTVSYKYPLGTGRNLWAPRPMGDIQRGSNTGSGPQKFGTISGTIEIRGKEAIRNVYSPTHKIEVSNKGETAARVTFESTGSDSDFQLFYGLTNSEFGMSLITYREAGKDGYFLLQLSPKDSLAESELANKDIVFVLDTSGSMADEGKMEKARAALLFGIKGLREGDRFNVISFAGEEHLMENKMITADAAGRKRGEEFVSGLKPNGGTNINDAVRAGLRQFDSSDRPKMMVFMTDGLPTVGESDVDRIVKNARDAKVEGLRLFTFGVGYDVNTRLLDKLAAENSGVADYIEPKENLEIKVSNFFSKVNSPVLTGLELDFGSVQTDLMYPRQLGDMFKGMQMSVIGRYKNESDLQNIMLQLRGKTGREARVFNYGNLDFPLRNEKNDFLPRLWATRRVGWLVEQIRSNGENKELRDEVVDLGTRYGIVTPYTSYLATDGSERESGRGSGFGANNAPPAPKSISSLPSGATTGRDAVAASKKAAEQRSQITLIEKDDDAPFVKQSVRKIGIKTFYLDNGVWTDSTFKAEDKLTEVKLAFASDAYFALAATDSEIGRYLALGEQVVIVWKGKVYRITK